jgi:hypothetical protein
MKTVTVDDYQRVRLPDATPRSKFAYETEANGAIRLVPVKAEEREPFPPGSLSKYFTGQMGKERDKLESALLTGCVEGPE